MCLLVNLRPKVSEKRKAGNLLSIFYVCVRKYFLVCYIHRLTLLDTWNLQGEYAYICLIVCSSNWRSRIWKNPKAGNLSSIFYVCAKLSTFACYIHILNSKTLGEQQGVWAYSYGTSTVESTTTLHLKTQKRGTYCKFLYKCFKLTYVTTHLCFLF